MIRLSAFGSLILLAALSELSYLSCYLLPNSPTKPTQYIAVTIFSSLCYLISIRVTKIAQTEISAKQLIAAIFIFAAIFRLSLIALPPVSSDDIYRYIWDGRVQAAGINPYRYAPTASQLSSLRNTNIFPKINHADLPTIYPPLAQALFLIAYLIGGDSVIGIKLLVLIAELLTAVLLFRILKNDISAARIIIYLWCPLPILEFALNGHVDALGIPFFMLLITALINRQPRKAAIALAATVLIKLMPIIFLPLVLFQLGLKKAKEFLLIFIAIILVAYLPFIGVGLAAFGSFGTYLQHWSFNGSLFTILSELSNSYRSAHICCYIIIAVWIASVALFGRDPIRKLFWTLTGFYLCLPTMFPWYLCWIVPLLIRQPSRAWYWLLLTAPLSYFFTTDNYLTPLYLIIILLEYLPFYGLLFQEAYRGMVDRQSKRLAKLDR